MFVAPLAHDLGLAKEIFNIFEGASSLGCNLAKFQLVSIRCDEEQVQIAPNTFPC
jgi:hypothetical protein